MCNIDEFDMEKIVSDAFENESDFHIFSDTYNNRKVSIIRRCVMKKNNMWKKSLVSAACGLGIIGLAGGTAYAINNQFNTTTEANVEAMFDNNDYAKEAYTEACEKEGIECSISVPGTDVYEYDGELAKKYLLEHISDSPIEFEGNGYKLTILSVMKDAGCAWTYYKVENPEGVDIFTKHDDNLMIGKGYDIDISKSSVRWIIFGGGKMFVDTDKSTDNCVYITEYSPLFDKDLKDKIVFETYAGNIDNNRNTRVVTEKTVDVGTIIDSKEAYKDDEAYARISPISISTYTKKITGGESDPYLIKSVKIIYKDGKEQIVDKQNEKQNCFYVCGADKGNTTFILNFIVDIENVKSVEINGIEYNLK